LSLSTQAGRIANCAFKGVAIGDKQILLNINVEYNATENIFNDPKQNFPKEYISGRFG
jgi:ABC-type phosphate transport system ATPase subunit